jgi:hypothetical protein
MGLHAHSCAQSKIVRTSFSRQSFAHASAQLFSSKRQHLFATPKLQLRDSLGASLCIKLEFLDGGAKHLLFRWQWPIGDEGVCDLWSAEEKSEFQNIFHFRIRRAASTAGQFWFYLFLGLFARVLASKTSKYIFSEKLYLGFKNAKYDAYFESVEEFRKCFKKVSTKKLLT